MVKTIMLKLDDSDFRKLSNTKNKLAILENKIITWETFILDMHNSK